MQPAPGDTWAALTDRVLPLGEVTDWAVRADCGAVVVFTGTVRDHAEGRSGVSLVVYEAYEEQVVPRLEAIATAARRRWPVLGRIALLHRIGPLALEEASVVVAVSAPHRPEAFEAARFCIDTLKETVPIWKQESWEGGRDWGLGASPVAEVGIAGRPGSGSGGAPGSGDPAGAGEGRS